MVEKIDAAGHAYVGAAFSAVESGAVRVHRERCAKVRNRNVDCLKCAAACTSGCISLVDGELVIDASKCVGCGTCATVCPTCALESLNPSDAELKAACLRAARADDLVARDASEGCAVGGSKDGSTVRREVVIACSQVQAALGDALAPGAVASVVCTGRVDESLLAGLAVAGVGRVTMLCGACERCAQRHGRDTAELVASTTRTVLGAWGCDLDVVVTDEAPARVLAADVSPDEARAACDAYFAEERACAPIRVAADETVPGAAVASDLSAAQLADGSAPHAEVDGAVVLDPLAGSKTDEVASRATGNETTPDMETAFDPLAAQLASEFAPHAEPCARLEAEPGSRSETEAESEANTPANAAPASGERGDETHGTGMRFYWNSGHSRKVAAHSLRVMKDGTLPHFIPDRRERLLDALAELGEPQERNLACRLWGAVVINGAKCVSCRMCATFCPTGAIAKFDDADGTIGVNHTPGDCVKCGSCQDICPADAIALLDEVRTDWLTDGGKHRYVMTPRPVSLTDNPHQILDTFRLDFDGDIFER